MRPSDVRTLIILLRDMDRQQTETVERGEREIAWYYFRDEIEDLLGLARGSLDTSTEQET